MAVPKEPVVFMKATSCLCGPNDDVVIPRGSVKTDWEVELGVVIGKHAKYVCPEQDALSHVAGYCVVNDVSRTRLSTGKHGTMDEVAARAAGDTFQGRVGPWLRHSG